MYNRRTWLNPTNSDSTGSIVAYDGMVTCDGESVNSTFLEIADCRSKVRLHLTSDDSRCQFIAKMELLRDEIDLFISHLQRFK